MVSDVDRIELLRLIEHEDAQLVDVLPDREYAEAHIPGAINIHLRGLTSQTVSALRRDKPVVVY
ncbi:MAG: rhodanese-like domain-containing protein [Acidimicrobiia bacterium]